MNRRIAFLSLLLWEGHHKAPSPFSLIPHSVRNLFAYAEPVIFACTGRQANAKLYQYLWINRVPKHSQSRRMVYLYVIFTYSMLVTLSQTAGTTCFSVPSWGISVFLCSEQMLHALELCSSTEFLISVQYDSMERDGTQLLFSKCIGVFLCL